MGMEAFLQKEPKSHARIALALPFPALESQAQKLPTVG